MERYRKSAYTEEMVSLEALQKYNILDCRMARLGSKHVDEKFFQSATAVITEELSVR